MHDTINSFTFSQLLLASLFVAVKFAVIGCGWGLWVSKFLPLDLAVSRKYVIVPALSILCSTIGMLFITLLLAAIDKYTLVFEWMLISVFCLSGLMVYALSKERNRVRLFFAVPGIAAAFVLFVVVLMLPERGEWMAGGWDPGIYVNQGVTLAQNGSPYRTGMTFLDKLSEEEQALFRQDRNNRKQFVHGILVDSGRNALGFQFFPLTPSFIANLYRCGGIRAAVRCNHFAAVISCFQVLAFLLLLVSFSNAVLALMLLMFQPVFVWHLEMPISEMLQQFIVFGMLTTFTLRSKAWPPVVMTALCMAAALLNRFSFLPFAGILLACGAWMDRVENDGARLAKPMAVKYIFLSVMLVGSALLSWVSAPVAVGGWGSISGGLLYITGVSLTIVMAACFMPAGNFFKSISEIPGGFYALLWFLWVPFFIFAPPYLYKIEGDVDRRNLLELVSYVGVTCSLLAWVGSMLVWTVEKTARHLKVYVVFATVVMSVLMLRKFIEPIYPWATRRYLHVVIPFIAIMVSYALTSLREMSRTAGWKHRTVFAVLVAALLVEITPLTLAAWRGTEYNGTAEMLGQVESILPSDALILADHFLYATPLTFICNRDVLVVSDMDRGDKTEKKAKFDKALDVLRRLAKDRPVYIFTITRGGLEYFPSEIPCDPEPLCDIPTQVRKVIHHKEQHPFETENISRRFRLWKMLSN